VSIVDDHEMKRLEELAGLRLTPAEREELRVELERVLYRFRSLQECDNQGIPPTTREARPVESCRNDTVEPSLPQEEVLRRAPQVRDGYFAVPPLQREPRERNW